MSDTVAGIVKELFGNSAVEIKLLVLALVLITVVMTIQKMTAIRVCSLIAICFVSLIIFGMPVKINGCISEGPLSSKRINIQTTTNDETQTVCILAPLYKVVDKGISEDKSIWSCSQGTTVTNIEIHPHPENNLRNQCFDVTVRPAKNETCRLNMGYKYYLNAPKIPLLARIKMALGVRVDDSSVRNTCPVI